MMKFGLQCWGLFCYDLYAWDFCNPPTPRATFILGKMLWIISGQAGEKLRQVCLSEHNLHQEGAPTRGCPVTGNFIFPVLQELLLNLSGLVLHYQVYPAQIPSYLKAKLSCFDSSNISSRPRTNNCDVSIS